MENKSQENYFYEENDINKIKQNYLICKEDLSKSDYPYNILTSSLHSVFIERFQNIFAQNELKELKQKLKSYDKEKNIKEITKINEMLNEAQHFYQRAVNDFAFYNLLIRNTEDSYNNWIITKESYNKICEDIVDSIINNLVKYEKELIILKDKIRLFIKSF